MAKGMGKISVKEAILTLVVALVIVALLYATFVFAIVKIIKWAWS